MPLFLLKNISNVSFKDIGDNDFETINLPKDLEQLDKSSLDVIPDTTVSKSNTTLQDKIEEVVNKYIDLIPNIHIIGADDIAVEDFSGFDSAIHKVCL